MNSLVEENYLKAMFILSTDYNGEVGTNELSKHLDLKMSTVTSMMKKLAQKGLVIYQSYKPPKLTDEGMKHAMLIIRKHRLTEMYLVEKMGFGWEEVHEIAEQIEHIKSNAFFSKMDELLDYPKFDPHGSPIPDNEGKIVFKPQVKLSSCQVGDKVRLIEVIDGIDDFLSFLNAHDICLGLEITVKSIEAFDSSMVVAYGKRTSQVLSNLVSELLVVEKV